MAKAPPPNAGGQPQQMQMVQVYVVPMPYSADGQQQAQWSSPDQPPASGSFGTGQHMAGAAMQQPGPNQWNEWQQMPNQQFANQPQHQTALQDYSGWGQQSQHQPMQDHSQQGWAQPGAAQQHQPHQQHGQPQPMMGGANPQQPMMGNGQQQPMLGNQQMVPMMPQDQNQYYFVQGNQMQGGQMQGGQMQGNHQASVTPQQQMPITNNTTPPSTTPAITAPAAPPAAVPSSAPASAKPKKRGLTNKKLGKDGVPDEVEPATPKEPEQQQQQPQQQQHQQQQPQQVDASAIAAKVALAQVSHKAARFEEAAARSGITGVGDSRSMIKALNLQPISAPSAKNRAAALRGKQGGPMGRAEEIQALKDFAASQKSATRGSATEETPVTVSPPVEEAAKPIEAPQPPAPQVQQQIPPAQSQALQSQQPTLNMPPMGQPNVMPVQPQTMSAQTQMMQQQMLQQQQQQQWQQQQQQAQQQAPAASLPTAAAQRTKGTRLKNATISRTGEIDKTPKAEEVRVVQTPVVQESLAISASSKIEESRLDTRQQDRVAQLQKSILLGRTNGFDRVMMLQFWRACKAMSPPPTKGDLGYRTATRAMADGESPLETWRLPRKGVADSSPASWRTGGSKSGKGGSKLKDKDTLKPGLNAYKIQKAQTREAELQRDVRALLNKICPENKERIIERLAQTQLDSVDEMRVVINIIFHKVCEDAHYCETYVDMIHALNKAYPEFPPEEEGSSPATFRRMLVNTCQDKFEEMLQKLEDDEGTDDVAKMDADELMEATLRKKRNAMATMKFIGNLFVRQLLAAAVIRRVIGDLLDGEPPEMQVEYALELVSAVGRQFENTEKDKAQITIILDRLSNLKSMKNSATGKPLLSKRVSFHIEDMVILRDNGWVKKGQNVAKKLDEVAHEQQREEYSSGSKGGKSGGKGGYGGRGGRH